MVDPSLAGWAGLHAAIVDNKAMPAPARDDPVFRHFLSAPGATPGIDGGGGGVEPAAVPNDQGLPAVLHCAAESEIHAASLGGGPRGIG